MKYKLTENLGFPSYKKVVAWREIIKASILHGLAMGAGILLAVFLLTKTYGDPLFFLTAGGIAVAVNLVANWI